MFNREKDLLSFRWRVVISSLVALVVFSAVPGSVSAQSIEEYFSYSSSVQLSQTEVVGTESFTATVNAEATSIKNFPVFASEASITGRIWAENQDSGTRVILNSSYTLNVNPFPNDTGETTSVQVSVPLQFPAGTASGGIFR